MGFGEDTKHEHVEHGAPEPNRVYSDRSRHGDFDARTAIYPKSAFELSNWSQVKAGGTNENPRWP